MSYTNDDLIANVKLKASIPSGNFEPEDYLSFANDEMLNNIVPLIRSVREEYFVTTIDVQIQPNKASYRIPSRSIGASLRDVQLVRGNSVFSLPRLNPEDVNNSNYYTNGFYLMGNSVVLNPAPTSSTDVLRLSYYLRPNKLVTVDLCAQIQSIDTVNNQVTVVNLPSSFGTAVNVDFIRSQSGYECMLINQAIVGISGNTISFSALPDDLAVNDWIALAGETPVPQIPEDLQSLLTQSVVVKCLESLGDATNLSLALGNLKNIKDAALNMLAPRVDGEPKKITSNTGLISNIRRGSRGWWF